MAIVIYNRQRKIEFDSNMRDIITKVIKEALKLEKFGYDAEVSVVLASNQKIRQINREYRNIDKPTDVLSFPMLEQADTPECGDFDIEDDNVILGDIVISLEKAKQQAEEYGHSLEREIGFLAAHGIFHLLGYDHISEEQTKIMREKEEKILHKIGLVR